MHTRPFVLGVALLIMAGLVCFAASAQPQEEATVTIQNGTFDPATVEVYMGSTVVWTNEDDKDQTVTSTEPLFDSGVIPPGGEFSYTFDVVGIYDYISTEDPAMRGQVKVIETEAGAMAMNETIPQVIDNESNLTSLAAAIETANMTEALSEPGPFTCFAPTDEAFAAVPADVMAALNNDTELLTQVLLYHVVDGQFMSTDFVDGMNLTTLEGSDLTITVSGEENVTDMNMTGTEENATGTNMTEETGMVENATPIIMVNEATVVEPDIEASNGVIHIIDAVLIPPDLMIAANETANMTANETANETATEGIMVEITEVVPANTT
jgi:uncharacterized surface protein with fasciclin (FAS1) repeats